MGRRSPPSGGLPVPPVAGPLLWYRADLGIVLNGSDVQDWQDQSGNGNHLTQADVTQQPEFLATGFNGRKTVSFDGVDEILGLTGGLDDISGDDKPNTVIWAGKLNSTAADRHMWSFASATAGGTFHGYRTNSSNRHSIRRISTQVNGDVNTADTGDHYFSQVFTGTTVSMYEDGVVLDNINGQPMDTATAVMTRFAIGGKFGTSEGDYMNCAVSELIVYASALSTANRQTVETAIKNRWGL